MVLRTCIMIIGTLLLLQFGLLLALNFQFFVMVRAYTNERTETKPVFSYLSLSQKDECGVHVLA